MTRRERLVDALAAATIPAICAIAAAHGRIRWWLSEPATRFARLTDGEDET